VADAGLRGGGICRNQPGEPFSAGPLVGCAETAVAAANAMTVSIAMRMKLPPIILFA
jgi:hypothetical protein